MAFGAGLRFRLRDRRPAVGAAGAFGVPWRRGPSVDGTLLSPFSLAGYPRVLIGCETSSHVCGWVLFVSGYADVSYWLFVFPLMDGRCFAC